MPKPKSIRARLTFAFSLSIAVILLASCSGLILYAKRAAESNAEGILAAAARVATRGLPAASGQFDIARLTRDVCEATNANLVLMTVGANSQVLSRSQPRVPPWPSPSKEDWRAKTVSLGSDTLVIAFPWRRTEVALQNQGAIFSVLSVIIFVATSVGAWLVVGRTLSPIDQLARQAQAASADKLRVALHAPSQDAEIVELVSTLNTLLGRLADAAAARGRFYAAASHELRTPLQGLSGHLQLGLSRPRTAAEYVHVIGDAHAQSLRLISLVRGLLFLNQLDGAPRPQQECTDLVDLCERAIAHFQQQAQEKGIVISTCFDDDAGVLSAPTHADVLVRNLLENAVRYTEPTRGVVVAVTASDGQVRLSVSNQCDPIEGWDESKLFEPFYRPDAARSAKTGGNGLGLAICKAIADANDWTITLEQEAGGVRATVLFACPDPSNTGCTTDRQAFVESAGR